MLLDADFCFDDFAKANDKWRFHRYYTKNFIRHLRGREPKTYRYRHFIYESPQMLEDSSVIKNAMNLNPRTYFCGYFQHLHCFSHIKSIIRTEFTLKSPLSNANQKLKERILSTTNSTFLHIRRGDYMQISHFIKLGSGYYNGALRAIKARVAKAHIFVFSDDIDFAKTHLLKCLDLELIRAFEWEFVDGNDESNAVQEMELMKSCQNAIIANSTFSWWAAYLMTNPRKVVVMPSRFFYDGTIPKVEYIKPNDYIAIDYNWGFEL